MLVPYGECLIVLRTMERADYTECELIFKLKLACLIFFLFYVSITCSSFDCFWAKIFKCFNFRNTHSKIFEKFFPVTFSDLQRECEILLPLLVLKKTLLIQYFRFTSFLSFNYHMYFTTLHADDYQDW